MIHHCQSFVLLHRRRDDLYNSARGLCPAEKDVLALPSETRSYDDSTPMDTNTLQASRKGKKDLKQQAVISKVYKDTLMYSEWLVEVPGNLEEEWFIIPCPEGRRTIVAAKGVRLKFLILKMYY